jgi:hypothetical protein
MLVRIKTQETSPRERCESSMLQVPTLTLLVLTVSFMSSTTHVPTGRARSQQACCTGRQ